MNFTYEDFDGQHKSGACTVHHRPEGYHVRGLTGPQGCSKTRPSPVQALEDLLGGRLLLSYKQADHKS